MNVLPFLAGLIGAGKMLSQQKNLQSGDDLNKYTWGIFSFYTEAGFPANFPTNINRERGIIICFYMAANCVQLVFSYNASLVPDGAFRTSYNGGGTWTAWKKFAVA